MNHTAAQTVEPTDEDHQHVSSIPQLLAVWVALLFFTFLTVAVTWIDMGAMAVWVAVLVAAIKVSIVALFYMHLKYENQFFGQILLTSVFFVSLLIGITLMDSHAYYPDVEAAAPASSANVAP